MHCNEGVHARYLEQDIEQYACAHVSHMRTTRGRSMQNYKKRYHYGKEKEGRKEEEGCKEVSPPRLISGTTKNTSLGGVFFVMLAP